MDKTPKAKSQTTPTNTPGGILPKGPIRVVPDANVLFDDPFLRGVAPQAIAAAAKFIDIKLTLADITRDELRNIVEEQLGEIVKGFGKMARKAKSLELKTDVKVLGLNYESKQALGAWQQRWASLRQMLPSLPYPKVDAEDLAQYSINQRRPFLEGDKGLRDYLLWVSILTAAQNDNCAYVLVTNDHGFYDEAAGALHHDLESELASHGLTGRIVVRRSFAGVVDEFVKPLLKPEQKVEVAIQSGQILDFTAQDDTIALLLDDYLGSREVPEEWLSTSDYYGASIDVVEDVTMIALASTLDLGDIVLATSEWEANVVITLSCPGYQERSETANVSFTVESLVDPNTLEVLSHEVSGHNLLGWYDEETGERIPY